MGLSCLLNTCRFLADEWSIIIRASVIELQKQSAFDYKKAGLAEV